ncbi:outer membrane beta-barrel protein [Sulfurihydrogenibium subterraneum]|uniref:outer membrane beta-barrel protein n=1 Tax=Sulfurihydrogenibium subterraneum TaxID=171121 RepID=UPI00048A826A|nr:outer membrane beta-barrel protein [Sulfurihydrogenibium subterraneum]
MKKLLSLTLLTSVAVANAGQITVLNSDIEFSGGLTTGYFYSNNTGSSNHDNFKVSNFIISLSSQPKDGGIGFNTMFGSILLPTLYDGGITDNKAILNKNFGVLAGYLTYLPFENLSVDVGLLTTNIGYEIATSFSNPNITYGSVFYAEPFIYPGIRITYSYKDFKFYGEVNKDKGYLDGSTSLPTSGAYAVGTLGTLYGINYALSYYDYTAYKNLINLVLSKSLNQNLDVALNMDYQWLDNTAKQQGHDKYGYGIAFYIIPKMENISFPIRIEYIKDGSKGKESGIYNNVASGYSFTITPTFKPSKNTYIRIETSYFKTDNKIFTDKSGNPKDSKMSEAVELGILF